MIELITKPQKTETPGAGERWQCDLYITKNGTTLYLPATAPGELQEGELQPYFEAREDWLWVIAEEKQYPAYQDRIDLRDFWNDLDDELGYLAATIPTIDNMTLTELRAAFKRSERRDERLLKALRYMMKKVGRGT